MPKTMSEIQTMFADGLVDKPPLLRSVEDKQNLVCEAVQALCDHILDKAAETAVAHLTAPREVVVLNSGPSADAEDDTDNEG